MKETFKIVRLAPRAIYVKDYRSVIKRTEDCIVNAKTELAKRRLVRTILLLDAFRHYDDHVKLMTGQIPNF